MTKSILIALAAAGAVLTLSACESHTAKDLPPGTYVDKNTSTDRDGTNYKSKTVTDVGYDENGNKMAVVKKKKTTDPKGLFNKSTDTSTTVVK